MYRKLERQQSRRQSAPVVAGRALAARLDLGIGLPERLALYVFGVLCLIAFLLEAPVPMAIAP